jgi:hypothetical protein
MISAIAAAQQQVPMTDPAPPHRLIRDPLHEHQRREVDDVLPFALDEVHDHRDGERAEGDEEQRTQY